jgi:Tol biopolymer transport system component
MRSKNQPYWSANLRNRLITGIHILVVLLLLGCAQPTRRGSEPVDPSPPLATTTSRPVDPTASLPTATYRPTEPASPVPSASPQSELDLQGRLILIRYAPDGNQLVELDLSTGETNILFQAPERSLLNAADVSPDGARIILAYSSPPQEGKVQFGYSQLYIMPSDGSDQPELFRAGDHPDEALHHPIWSPDGQSIYYTHLYRRDADEPARNYRIEKVSLSGGVEVIVDDALWPRLSPDGSMLAYLTFDPGQSTNELYLTDLTNQSATPIITADEFPTVDAHQFSPDGQQIYFSAPNTQSSSSSLFEKITGVRVAYAHNVPSDWYRVAIQGGEVERLTQTDGIGLVGDFSRDGKYFVFFSQSGLFLMQPDGSDLRALGDEMLVGTVNWLP